MSLVDDQKQFYGDLYGQFGDDPRSLSWRDRQTQDERFMRIARLFERETEAFAVHEIGCGLGHFGDFLREHHPTARYSGSDIVPHFVNACRQRFPQSEFFEHDVSSQVPPRKYDFVTLSGTFNPRLKTPHHVWQAFVFRMLDAMFSMCTKGIAANFLTAHADPHLMQKDLHYQGEPPLIEHIVGHLSRHYELDHASPLFEFTIRVYKPEHVRSLYTGESFAKYFRNVPSATEGRE